jgi:signal transduction histidine kinase
MLDALERVTTAQRRFVQDASHEMRAPLTSIKGNLEFLQRARDLPAEERSQVLAEAAAEAGRLSILVSDLLMLARVDAAASGGYGLHEAWLDEQLRGRREQVALDEVVMEVFRQGRGQLQARRKNLRLSVNGLEPMTVIGDPGQVRQLVYILLDNAIKYTPSGGRVRLAVTRTEDGWAELIVEDSGIGITAEDMPHIFERFYRADQARARDEGSGLGLAIAEWIVQAHGGTMSVASVPGEGSTFTVRLRAERREGEPTPPAVPAVDEGGTGEVRGNSAGVISGAIEPLARIAGTVSMPLARSTRTTRSPRRVGDPGASSSKHRSVRPPAARANREKRRHTD